VTTTSASLNDTIDNVSAAVKAGPTEDRILLGTFRFTGLTNGSMTINTADPNPAFGSDDTVTGGNVVLDPSIANSSAQITVVNVPEPGTMVLAGLLASGIAGVGLRRARRKATT